jgi:hypothetical protein
MNPELFKSMYDYVQWVVNRIFIQYSENLQKLAKIKKR